MKGTYSLLNEDLCLTKSTIELYIRISYFGDSLITEMESPENIRKAFYARDETGDDYIYQFRELSMEQLQSGGWDSCIFSPTPTEREQLICNCKELEELKKLLAGHPSLIDMLTKGSREGAGEGDDDDEDGEGGKGLAMGGKGGMADLDKDKNKKKVESRVSKGKNALQEYLKAEAEHWKLLMEMLALAKNAPKGLSPSAGTRKGTSAGPCVSVMPCPPCQPCIPCPPCPPCSPCPPCYITSCSPCG